MPFLSIKVDGTAVAIVNTMGRDMVTAHIGGSRNDEDFADLVVTGGVYDHEGTMAHRIWAGRMKLVAGRSFGVAFLSEAAPFGKGTTIDELYPKLAESQASTAIDRAELAAEIRQLGSYATASP